MQFNNPHNYDRLQQGGTQDVENATDMNVDVDGIWNTGAKQLLSRLAQF